MKKVVLVLLSAGAGLLIITQGLRVGDVHTSFTGNKTQEMEPYQHCSKDGGSTAYVRAVSEEIGNQSGSFTATVVLYAEDTTFLFTDSLQIHDSSIFQIALSQTFGSSYLLPGDTTSCKLTVNYNPSVLPFSYRSFLLSFRTMNSDSIYGSITARIYVYFTPYGTTEVWNTEDFPNLPRTWISHDSVEPARISIVQDSIPASSRPAPENITEPWQEDFDMEFVEGLPYAVQMAALHPDSVAAYIHRDSTEELNADDTAGMIYYKAFPRVLPKRFTGTITGRLAIPITNDLGVRTTIFPSGVKIKVRDWDKGKGLNRILTWGYTDNNGNFSLSYDIWQSPFEGHGMELYLELEAESSNEFDIKVKDGVFTAKLIRSLGEALGTYTNNLGDWTLWNANTSGAFRTFHWTRSAYTFCRDQIGTGLIEPGLNVNLNKNGSNYLTVLGAVSRINLEPGDELHESVIQHEFGHHAMWKLMNQAPGLDDICIAREHNARQEGNNQLAWSEGWATGFGAMLDLFFLDEDGEYGNYTFEEGGQFFGRSFPTEGLNYNRLNGGTGGNGIRSEYHIACALNDLYDGPDKFTGTVNDNLWNDGVITNVQEGYTNGSDMVSLSAYDICKPLINQKISDVESYFKKLLDHLSTNASQCDVLSNVGEVFRENRVTFDVRDNFYEATSFSTDEISIPSETFFEPQCLTAWNIQMSVSELSSSSVSYNLGTLLSQEIKWLHDPLTISGGGKLWLNENQEMRWVGSGLAAPLQGSTLNVRICNKILTLEDGGVLEIGSSDDLNFAHASIEPNTSIIVKDGGRVVIHQGSSLTIESNGLLVFEEGAEIELAGSNAILEIKGRLELGEDAEFLTTGSGLVRFNMPEYPNTNQYNIFTTGNNCKVTFSGKNVEVAEGTYVYPMDNLAMFTLYNSTVKLGTDAFLNLGCQVTLESSIFRKIPTYPDLYVHAGIKLYGQNVDAEGRVVIKNCTFLDAKYGVRAFQTPGGNSTKITGSTFTNCDFPLTVYDRGAYLFGNVFFQCNRGVLAEFTTNYFNVESNIVKNISGIGLISFAQPGSKFIVAGNVYKDSYEAMYFNRTNAYLRCNAIYRNYMIAMTENLGYYRANTIQQARFWYEQGGNNLFEEIVSQSYVGNWAYFNGNSRYIFRQGYNHFKRVNNNQSTYTISATIDRPNNQAASLDLGFENNFWTPHMALLNPSVPNFLSLNPSTSHNPHFYITVNNAASQPIFVYGSTLSSFPGCPITAWAGAITYKDSYIPGQIPGILFKNLPDEGLLNDNLLYDQSRSVSGGVYNGQVLETALRSALNGTYLGLKYDKDSVNINELLNLGNLLIHTIGSLNYQHDDDYMYDEYMSALNSAISAGQITTLNQSAYVSQAVEIIEDKLDAIAEMEFTYPEAYYSYRFTYNLDKAYLYRNFRMYPEALSQIAYTETFANDKDLNLLGGVGCFIYQEKQWRDSTITLFEFGEEVTLCSKMLDSSFTSVLEPLDSFSGEESGNDIVSYTLSPNPTSSSISMDMDLEEDAFIEVRIYSKNGVLMLSDVLGNKLAGSHFKNYNVSAYFPDVYIFIVFADGVPYSENFVVSP